MATAEQLKALLKSYGDGNGEHFASVALQIAADAARSGKSQLAQQLKVLVDDIKRKQASGKVGGAVPIARPTGELASLLVASYPQTRLSEMVLTPEVVESLQRVLANIADSQNSASMVTPLVESFFWLDLQVAARR